MRSRARVARRRARIGLVALAVVCPEAALRPALYSHRGCAGPHETVREQDHREQRRPPRLLTGAARRRIPSRQVDAVDGEALGAADGSRERHERLAEVTGPDG